MKYDVLNVKLCTDFVLSLKANIISISMPPHRLQKTCFCYFVCIIRYCLHCDDKEVFYNSIWSIGFVFFFLLLSALAIFCSFAFHAWICGSQKNDRLSIIIILLIDVWDDRCSGSFCAAAYKEKVRVIKNFAFSIFA